jgi:hypothetical protein
MLDLTVISSDEAFADVLCDACMENGNVRNTVLKTTLDQFSDSHPRDGVALLVVENLRNGPNEILRLRELAVGWRVVAVLREDDPALAFDLIAQGAQYVFAVPMQGTTPGEPNAVEMLRLLLYPLLAELVSGQPPLSLLKGDRLRPTDKVFMSMRYDSSRRNTREELDYHQAIVPALRNLGVDIELSRSRRNRYGRTTNAKVVEEIHCSRVILVQVSELTAYVAYEIGAADSALRLRTERPGEQTLALEEMILLHPVAAALPTVAEGLDRLEYVNRTDLALKLFLGFGGSWDDLRGVASQPEVKVK